MNLNLAPSPFPMEQTKEKEHDENQETFTFGLNHHHHHQIVSSSSSSSASCHIFFNQAQDHAGFFHPQLYQPHHYPLQDDYYSFHGGSSYEIENKVEKGLKLSLWKKEDENMLVKESSSSDGVKWLMKKKKKKKDEEGISMMNGCSAKMEVKKVNQSSSMDTDLSSNSSSYNCSTPIRVCSDCHTTKTPLWRSGPKGPKSLCNACGIRQRKARRAMAAAAAGDGGGGLACDPMKVKVKVKMGKSGMKKRCKSGGELEEFLIRLSEKLAIHRVFPQDEKEAAILLMALSSGLVHG